ncbi:MAG: putative DNA-3-methyladenine glycosylase [Parcubacteria group bacterium GW2011_GWC1_45_9]|nr:MAG: putative DNA-3-methyladenine glycosylase [Parcubacteria group bacterium GW2011_GWA1_Parcubacteria_45_10]KKT89316.1 MAG: putative DNA-3-methyladenine glycosylase [Parcubacteria group bacterium GW2011_GWB1_45_10]KKU17132.1 MAG: putative DNA-3-methyladenine glycosylase [Parcubacteria group bacterium GW2011_GWC1_45_9]HCI05388.1 DNA-3-methyladenine glycosylase 2 family protein [Patescibacteria group bacterium]
MERKILNHFKKKDKTLYKWALKVGKLEEIKKDRPGNYFSRLCYEIVGQQLSGKVASVIFLRFKKLFPGNKVTAKKVAAMPHKKLRGVGMSNAKAKYVKYLAKAVLDKKLPLSKFDEMTDEEVRESLLAVKGIGPWTCEMFLMFTLARPDIFSFGDLGLRKGLMKIYRFKKEPSRKKAEKIIASWSPYKSFASRILWQSLDNE